MRIIAGEKRGARLKTLDGDPTRPTLERVKEAVFSSVQFLLPGAVVLDLFAGSGQMGLEALSRGAARCTFVDENSAASAIQKENARTAGLFEKSRFVSMQAEAFLQQSRDKYDVIFLDPPYNEGYFPGLLQKVALLCAPGATVVCETELGANMPDEVDGLKKKKQHKYGTVLVTRYSYQDE